MSATAIDVRGLTKAFGGVQAVSNVSFSVPQGSLTALIGPNGAGKTTVFNVITNLYRPDAGETWLFCKSLRNMSAWQIARSGVVRTFQTARVFPGMTTVENVLAGAHLNLRATIIEQMLGLARSHDDERRLADRAETLLDIVGLTRFRDIAATDLPMGAQKLLEVIRALMAMPRLLLLDEPAAGLNDAETAELALLLRAVRKSGITLLVVEHNMPFVMGSADHVIVMDAGTVVAQGSPQEIQEDRRVIEAYVGGHEEAG